MGRLIGEFEIRIDPKGRFKMPAAYLKQLGGEADDYFVVNMGLNGNLVIYPKKAWEIDSDKVDLLNEHDPEEALYIDMFYSGIDEVSLDKSGRFLVKKRLLEYAGITTEAVLSATSGKIKMWNKESYKKRIAITKEGYASMASRVLGKIKDR